MNSGNRYFIAGYYGFGNIGDEAVVSVIINDIRTLDPNASFILTAEREEQALMLHPSVDKAISWRNTNDVINSINISNYVIIGGGGLWNSYFDYEELDCLARTDNYAFHIYNVPIIARLLLKPVVIYAVGGGYIYGEFPKKQATIALECASLIMVRDCRTQSFFKKLGISEERIKVTGDPAFRLISSPLENKFSRWASDKKPIIVILRHWLNETECFIANIAEKLTMLSTLLKRPLLFIPFDVSLHILDDLSDDTDICQKTIKLIPKEIETILVDEEYAPENISYIIKQSSLVISMRLHGNILAISNAKPVIGISYDPKVKSIFDEAGLAEYVLSPKDAELTNNIIDLATILVNKGSAELLETARAKAIKKSLVSISHINSFFEKPTLSLLSSDANSFINKIFSDTLRKQALLNDFSERVFLFARELVNQGSWDKAFAVTSILADTFHENPEWYYLRSVSGLALKKDYQYCLKGFDIALAKGYNPAWVLYNRAQCFLSMKRYDEAQFDLDECCRLNPDIDGISTVQEWINQAKKQSCESPLVF